MIEAGWGRIVTIVSDAGRVGESGMAAYGAAKAGAAGFTRGLAMEVGRHGITANAVSLGTMRTPMTEALWSDGDPERQRAILRRYAIRRPGEPEDVAGMVALPLFAGGVVDHRPDLSGQRRQLVRALTLARRATNPEAMAM